MYSVELYNRVRRACHVDGMSERAAARHFGIDRKTVFEDSEAFSAARLPALEAACTS